jgi:hypothetical protein
LTVSPESSETESGLTGAPDSAKKNFVEPEMTVPVDILEAKTFFHAVDSGGTN